MIVGIVAGYLRQTGRSQWMPGVWVGVALACVLCLALGIALDHVNAEFPQRQQELFEGLVGLLATVILTSMVFWMHKAARSIKAQLHDSIDAATGSDDGRSLALVGVTDRVRGALQVTRVEQFFKFYEHQAAAQDALIGK